MSNIQRIKNDYMIDESELTAAHQRTFAVFHILTDFAVNAAAVCGGAVLLGFGAALTSPVLATVAAASFLVALGNYFVFPSRELQAQKSYFEDTIGHDTIGKNMVLGALRGIWNGFMDSLPNIPGRFVHGILLAGASKDEPSRLQYAARLLHLTKS